MLLDASNQSIYKFGIGDKIQVGLGNIYSIVDDRILKNCLIRVLILSGPKLFLHMNLEVFFLLLSLGEQTLNFILTVILVRGSTQAGGV